MKSLKLAFLFALCACAWAQSLGSTTGPFAGPTILTNGVGGVGRRAGQDVNLRYFGNINAIYDTGITPFAVKDGELYKPAAQFGVEAGLGAYGTHSFRHSVLGVDYSGNFRHYNSSSNYDGSNQMIDLGYTTQVSRRWVLDMRQAAGTQSFGTTLGTDVTGTPATGTVDSNSLLFDNRTNYLQTQFQARYLVSRRTVVTAGGSYYTIHRQARALAGVNGYNLNGSIQRQLTRRIIIIGQFQHLHYDYPRVFGESDINYFVGQFRYQIGRSWQVGLGGGAFTAETQGIQTTSLDPTLSALLGVNSVQTAFYKKSTLPIVMANISKQFRKSSFGASFNTSVSPGNGVYLTSQQKSVSGSYAYTGISRMSLSLTVGATQLKTIGQTLQDYNQINGSATVNYRIGKTMNIVATYIRRYQDIVNNPFLRNSSRISIGIYFSPGDVPISFH